jgi:hypothetical protein
MTSTKTTSSEITLSRMRHSDSIGLLNLHVPKTACGYHINHLVKEIPSPAVRDIVGTVFEDLLRLLECLSLSESHLRQADAASETFALFQIIHDEARTLVKFISDEALTCEALTEEVAEALDGITFAINHDLHRVFENQQHGADATPQVVVGQLFRAHDLLTNCLQQSTISLAITFDRKLDGTKLFDDSDTRYRQSIQLCEDISTLLELVEACGGRREGSAFASLTARVEVFRNESLECLMYSDWPQFEGFCEKISVPEISSLELESVLHQFRCYLETLLGQVRMRAVLANVIPAQFGTDNGDLTQDEHVAWDPFAVAV